MWQQCAANGLIHSKRIQQQIQISVPQGPHQWTNKWCRTEALIIYHCAQLGTSQAASRFASRGSAAEIAGPRFQAALPPPCRTSFRKTAPHTSASSAAYRICCQDSASAAQSLRVTCGGHANK